MIPEKIFTKIFFLHMWGLELGETPNFGRF